MRRNTVSRAVIARFAVGSVATGGFVTLPGLVLVLYLTDVVGTPPVTAGVLVVVAKLLSVLLDPVVGGVSDRMLHTRGTRRGTMLLGAATLPVLLALTFAAPLGLGIAVATAWVGVLYLLAVIANSLFLVPYLALPAELTDGYDERTRIVAWRVIALTVGILLFGAGGPALRSALGIDPWADYLVMGVAAALVVLFTMLVATTSAPRGAPFTSAVPASRRGPGFYARAIAAFRESRAFRLLVATFALHALASGVILTTAAYEARWVLGNAALLSLLVIAFVGPALLATPLWALLARHTGKRNALLLASGVFVLGCLACAGTLLATSTAVVAATALAGVGFAGMQTLAFAMLPDVMSADTHEFGSDRGGVFGGLWATIDPLATALGSLLVTIGLAASGYAGTADVQPESVTGAVIAMATLVPAVLVALSTIPLSRFPITKSEVDA